MATRPNSGPSSGPAAFLDAIPLRFTTLACALCAFAFIGLSLRGQNLQWDEASRWGYLPPDAIWEGKPWGLISSVFVHLQFFHIAFNVYWLWILGNCLEQKIGSWRWLAFFLSAAWVSSALQLLLSGETGIGMSGVGYALFGFGWVARSKMPEFGRILDNQTVLIFVLWLVGCAIATQLKLVNIGNAAHLGGMVFGAGVAGLFVLKWKPVLLAPALLALCALSIVPLFWCPTSPTWNALQADKALERKDYNAAIKLYERSLEMGQDPKWAWTNLALLYQEQHNASEYAHAVSELRQVDAKAAQQFEDDPTTVDFSQAEPTPKPKH